MRGQAVGPGRAWLAPGSEAQALSAAVPWSTDPEAAMQGLDDWSPRTYEPAAADPQPPTPGKPLKINRDLLLVSQATTRGTGDALADLC